MDKEELLPEEFPEGPVGAAKNKPLGKSTPWGPRQRQASNFVYPKKAFHEGLTREDPTAHPTHDEADD